MGDSGYAASVVPVPGGPGAIAEHAHAMAEAGSAHLQLVLDPITIETVRVVGEAAALLDRA